MAGGEADRHPDLHQEPERRPVGFEVRIGKKIQNIKPVHSNSPDSGQKSAVAARRTISFADDFE